MNMALVAWIVLAGVDSETARTFLTVSVPSVAGLVSAYVLGAAWENRKSA